jgi:thioredoxin-like negative regulator of GroEL
MTVKDLDYENFKGLVDPSKVNVIKLWHERCPMCVNLGPIYEKVAEAYKNDFCFFQVNTVFDKQRIASRLRQGKRGGVPEIYLFHSGKFKEIPWPSAPTKSGYSEKHLTSFLEHCKRQGSSN